MFVRFRQTARRLQASLIETRRQGGKVRHEHVASLGAVPLAPSAVDRIALWTKLHQRLDALSNRIDAAQRGAILTAIHARIPMPTADDQQAVQLERAREDARFWQSLADMAADDIEGHRGLLTSTQQAIVEREKASADFVMHAHQAKERLARAEQGEAVAGIPTPLTRKDFLRISGMTEVEARHCEPVHEIAEQGWLQLMLDELMRRKEKAEKSVVREIHRLLRT
jgi:uncharacterized protein (DUF885 family)